MPLAAAAVVGPRLDIPAGTAPVIDGVITAGEWDDAVRVTIEAPGGREVQVRIKHDGRHILAAFTGLVEHGAELYPELLIGAGTAGTGWQPTDHWFHASYRDCDASGRPNDYSTCSPTRPGWNANNFPLAADGAIEMSIALDRAGIAAGAGDFRIAFNVTDTRTLWSFWPVAASFEAPGRWAVGRLLQPSRPPGS